MSLGSSRGSGGDIGGGTIDTVTTVADIAAGDLDTVATITNPVEVQTDLSTSQTFTIGNGADGSAVSPADLGANYKIILVSCADAQYIAASTSLSAEIGHGASDGPFTLYEQDDPSTQWSKGDLPTSGDLAFILTHATGARRVRLVLSNNASGGSVVFTITGIDKAA